MYKINKNLYKLFSTSIPSDIPSDNNNENVKIFSGVCSKEEFNHLHELNCFESVKYVRMVDGSHNFVLFSKNKRFLSYFAEYPIQIKRTKSFQNLSRKVLCYTTSMIMFVFKFKSYEKFILIMEDLRHFMYKFNDIKFQICLPEKKTTYYYSYFCTFLNIKMYNEVISYLYELKKIYNKEEFDFYDISKNVKKHVNRKFESKNLIIFNKSLSINLYKDRLENLYIHSSNFNFIDYFIYIEKGIFYTQYYCTFIFSKNPFINLTNKLKSISQDFQINEPIKVILTDSPDEQKKTFLKILTLQLLSINKRNTNDGSLTVPYDLTISAIFKIQDEYIEKKTNNIKFLEFYLVATLISKTLDLNSDVFDLFEEFVDKEKQVFDLYEYSSIACLGYEFAIVDV